MLKPRSIAAVLVVGLLCQATLIGCKKSADAESAPLVTVQAERPELGDISEHISADATLSPLTQAAISPKITAPVKAFYVQRGSKVKAGQLLATLENRDLTGLALDSKGQYDAAQASYDLQSKAQVPEEYAKAELDVAQTKAQLHLQGEIAASRQKLFRQGAIAGREYDMAVAALTQAQAAYDNARNHLTALRNVSRKAAVQQALGQLSSARGKYQAAEAQVSYSKIISPISGVVTDRALFPGETASSGSPLLTVMDTSALLAKVHLSQIIAQRLSLGDSAQMAIPGIDGGVPARVTLISPALDPGSTTVEVWIKVENVSGTFKAGTPVRVSVIGRTVAKAVKIPLTAVLTNEDGTKSVMVVQSNGNAHKINVVLGIKDGEDVEVTQGLSSQEMVITTGAYGLEDGTKVKVGKLEEEAK
ncbi:MAG: efflux RND transporter periplasmic adaptor subunit [Acidobacteriaceae bacterium]|nr:efflux RND transporter periplasmic adaptor subunit [Acidobacteriaceae bacterium]